MGAEAAVAADTGAMPGVRLANTHTFANNSKPRFLVVASAGDGITRWRVALAEAMSFALSNKLIMVEPCVRNGRIVPCDEEELKRSDRFSREAPTEMARALGQRGSLRPLSAYKDTALMRRTFPEAPHLMLPYLDFIRDWDGASLLDRSRLVCAAYMSTGGCNRTYQDKVWSGHVVGNSKPQRKAASLLERVRGQPVLQLHYLRYRFFSRNQSIIERVFSSFSKFADNLEKLVDTLPKALGLAPGYFAYHWRSEKICHDYTACSRQLLSTKLRIEQKHASWPGAGARALLISDIPATEQPLWGGMSVGARLRAPQRKREAAEALKRLLAANMTKLDLLPGMSDCDSGALSVLDLLLGVRSGYLVTCSSKNAPCAQKCAWSGGYAGLMEWFRHGGNVTVEW